ncbi:MAG TPA: ABC transporter substrate-binding protein [Candidatus Acidoferrales bacterium]|nr:ABC transporter substrate-binding protein [Candidatus Acidoferrales bacterium]
MRTHWNRSEKKRTPGRTPAIFALAAALAIAMTCGGCKSATQAGDSGTVNFLIESMPTNLDPRIGTDAQSQHLDGLIYDGLVKLDAQMNIVPDLAERWETPDPRTYIFHLRHGVKFHDGRAFTSADVKYTFDSLTSGEVKSVKRGTFAMLESVEAPDAYTLIFHLSEPSASFMWNLTPMAIGIVPAGSGHTPASDPIGTGPFRFVSMTQDEDVVLDRNADYFGGAPKIPEVRFRVVPDAITRALELRKGTADIGGVTSLTPDMVDALAKVPGLVVDDKPGTVVAYVAMNFDDPILSHREVRQALAYATDRDSLIRYLLRGQARAASSLLPPNHWAYDPHTRQYPYDPAQAEHLLDAAGFPRAADGVRFHVTMKTSTEESARLLSEALAGEWRRVGVVLDLRPLETATFLSDIGRGSFQLYTLRWVGANNDPDIFDYVFNSQRMPPLGANRGHYRNPALDALLGQEKIEMDRDKRKAILAQIQKMVADDEPYINLWYVDNVCVHRARVTGITLAPAGEYSFLDTAEIQ